MSSREVDFLVVGGGPAGSAFGILAARSGARVAVIERDHYERLRPGEHLDGRVRPTLAALGVPPEGAAGIAAASPGIVSMWGGNTSLVRPYRASGHAMALCVDRRRFDAFLCQSAQKAGANVMAGRRLANAERSRSRTWNVSVADRHGCVHRMVARSIVDASGRRAHVARSQGSRRINHGDLLAITSWLEVDQWPPRAASMLLIEACPFGWWSLSVVGERTLIATLYTSAGMMRAGRASPVQWWGHALAATRHIREVAMHGPLHVRAMRVFPACPSRSSVLFGDGWITIGDAAIALDPLSGQGVALAIETAFRAFEAARVDPTWTALGNDYRDALLSRLDSHLDGRAEVYGQAASILPQEFLQGAVAARGEPPMSIRRRRMPVPKDHRGEHHGIPTDDVSSKPARAVAAN